MVNNIISDLIDTQDQLGERDTINLIFKLFDEDVGFVNDYVKLDKTNIGHAFILGHSINGKLGVAAGIDSSQVTLGNGGLGASSQEFLLWKNDTYEEYFIDNTFEGSGTATWNTTDNKLEG